LDEQTRKLNMMAEQLLLILQNKIKKFTD